MESGLVTVVEAKPPPADEVRAYSSVPGERFATTDLSKWIQRRLCSCESGKTFKMSESYE